MNFQKIPLGLIESIVGKCQFETVLKMRQTCSTVNQMIKKKNLDKINVGMILFLGGKDELIVTIDGCLDNKLYDDENYHCFDKSYDFSGASSIEDVQKAKNGKIRQVLSSIKSVVEMEFYKLTIDGPFVQMLKYMSIQWKEVSVNFVMCTYEIPKSDCLALWKLFESVDESKGSFQENNVEVISDEMMIQTLPSITFSTDPFDHSEYEENPNLTDRTLEFLAENRPQELSMGHFASSFTVDGIILLFKKVINSPDPNVDFWFIGAVRLSFPELRRIFNELVALETETVHVLVDLDNNIKAYEVTVICEKEIAEGETRLRVDLIKPAEVVENEEIMDQWQEDEDSDDSEMEDDENDI